MLHVIASAQYAVAYSRRLAVNAWSARVHLKAENEQFRLEVTLLTEEIQPRGGSYLTGRLCGPRARDALFAAVQA